MKHFLMTRGLRPPRYVLIIAVVIGLTAASLEGVSMAARWLQPGRTLRALHPLRLQQQPVVQQPSEIELVISGDPGTPPRYAVPDFVAATPEAAEIAKTLGQVLWDDLAFEREFYLIPRDTYATVPEARTPERVPFGAWRELGADAVVFGGVQRSG